MFKKCSVLIRAAAIVFTASAVALAGPIGVANPGILPPGSEPYGKTYGEWGAAWSQWVFTTTTENCPVLDTTGEFALVNQSGQVYFLAGTFGTLTGSPWETPVSVTRNVTIPAGIGLCIPIINWGLVYPDDLPTIGASKDTPLEEALDLFYVALNGYLDSVPEENMALVVDGMTMKNLLSYRAQSEPYMVYAPADNVQSDLMNWSFPDWAPFYTEGWYPAISDGYYVILAPLRAGSHTVYLRAGPADSKWFEVTYHLTVQGGPRTGQGTGGALGPVGK